MPKSGFAVIVGRSNVGKSTLLNALIGTKIAIVTEKPQTTRSRIQGILNDERGQVVFIDTPGLFQKTGDIVTERLNTIVADSLRDIDVVIYVVDPTRAIGNEERELLRLLEAIPKEKKILVINKSDLFTRSFEHEYERELDKYIAVIRVSALEEKGIEELKDKVFELMNEGEYYFPEGQVTTLEHTDWIAELIREKAFKYLQDEVPYSVSVRVDEYGEKKGIYHIHATILTNSEHYKGIIIGRAGLKIGEIGTAARKELEVALGKKVFLKLNVDVDEAWEMRFAHPES
ncbi:MAG: GTPase Era [bacterium]